MLDVIFNIYFILVVNDLLVLDDSFSRVFFWICFCYVIGRDELKCLLLRVFVLFVLML